MGKVKYDEAKPIILISHMVNLPKPIFEAVYESKVPATPATRQTNRANLALLTKNCVLPENQNIKCEPAITDNIRGTSEALLN